MNKHRSLIQQEIDDAPKCRCACHFHPGAYRCEPCAVCGHHNSQGQVVGGIVRGVWVGHRYGLTEQEQEELLNQQ